MFSWRRAETLVLRVSVMAVRGLVVLVVLVLVGDVGGYDAC